MRAIAGTDRITDGRGRGRKLKAVAIATRNDRRSAPAFLRGARRREEVVCLVARRFGIHKSARCDEIRQHIELVQQFLVKLSSGLIAVERLVTVRGFFQRIPCHHDGAGFSCS